MAKPSATAADAPDAIGDPGEADRTVAVEMMDSFAFEPEAIEVPAGETASITWHFAEAGEVLYGCHEPGHYDAGMVGTITVG